MTAFKLQGIVAAPVLPMLPDHSIDWTSLRSYIRWIARQKPTAIAMNMDASEGPSLDPDEQLEVLRVCKDVIGGTVPLVSGLIVGSTAAAVRFGNELKQAGAEALAVFPPFPTFLGNPVPSEMIYAYHKAIADGVGLPLIAFQFPKAWGPDFPPDTLARLAAIPQIIGLKEASFDTTKTVETIATARSLPRKLGIMKGMEEAGRMKAEAEASLAKYKKQLDEIDSEVERIRREMKEAGEAESARIVREAKERRERMERDARTLVEQELKAARETLVRETVRAAVKSAEATLVSKIGDSDRQRLGDEFLASVKASGAALRGRL